MGDFTIPTNKQIAFHARSLILSNLTRIYSLPSLAAECGVTPYTLKRIFKNEFAISIADFSLRSRIERAKTLLISTNNTLQMIGEAVGYSEGNNFQNAFKRVVGMSPGQWRKKNPDIL
jgi:AraC-like DNA-binding protein